MISYSLWLSSTMFFIPMFGLTSNRTHLLSALLCLEGMMLPIFLYLSAWALKINTLNHFIFPLVTMTLSACEAGLGLSLMVATARSHHTDNLNIMNLLQC